MGQLTHNIVARNIRMLSAEFQSSIIAENGVFNSELAKTLREPIAEHLGIRPLYAWGLYNYCGGSSDYEQLECNTSKFGHQVNIPQAISDDLPISSSSGTVAPYQNQHDIDVYTRAGFYLLFVGTILVGVAFLLSLLTIPPALTIASLWALLGFALLVCGATMYTYFISRMKDLASAGIDISYGNALWMFWAAIGAALFAIPALVIGATDRSSRFDY